MLQDALECCRWDSFLAHGERHPWLWLGAVKESGVTASLVVDIKTGAFKGAQDGFRFEYGELGHRQRELRQSEGDAVGSGLDVFRDDLSGLAGAFKVGLNRIFGHFSGFVSGVAEGANFRDRGHDDVIAASGELLVNHRVAVLGDWFLLRNWFDDWSHRGSVATWQIPSRCES